MSFRMMRRRMKTPMLTRARGSFNRDNLQIRELMAINTEIALRETISSSKRPLLHFRIKPGLRKGKVLEIRILTLAFTTVIPNKMPSKTLLTSKTLILKEMLNFRMIVMSAVIVQAFLNFRLVEVPEGGLSVKFQGDSDSREKMISFSYFFEFKDIDNMQYKQLGGAF
jgi:hypothetical protein